MPVAATTNYPSLETVMNLARSICNDDKKGATGTPGEGQILTDSSPMGINFLNSAIREMYRDVRIMGQPTLINDNVILLGLPPINSALGVGAPNPSTQVALQFTGFYDGLQMNAGWSLPNDLLLPMSVWCRLNGSQYDFQPMNQTNGPLCSAQQGGYSMGEWEWRGDAIWMNGSTQSMDLRLRYVQTFPDLASDAVDFNLTYIPIMDCQDCVADKIAVRYTARLGGDSLPYAAQRAKDSLLALRQQLTRNRQLIDVIRPSYGQGRASGGAAGYLY